MRIVLLLSSLIGLSIVLIHRNQNLVGQAEKKKVSTIFLCPSQPQSFRIAIDTKGYYPSHFLADNTSQQEFHSKLTSIVTLDCNKKDNNTSRRWRFQKFKLQSIKGGLPINNFVDKFTVFEGISALGYNAYTKETRHEPSIKSVIEFLQLFRVGEPVTNSNSWNLNYAMYEGTVNSTITKSEISISKFLYLRDRWTSKQNYSQSTIVEAGDASRSSLIWNSDTKLIEAFSGIFSKKIKNGNHLISQSTSTFSLSLEPNPKYNDSDSYKFSSLKLIPKHRITKTQKETDFQLDIARAQNTLKGIEIQGILNFAKTNTHFKKTKLFKLVRAWAYLNPDDIDPFIYLVKASDKWVHTAVVQALSIVGNAPSQRALIRIYEDHLDSRDKSLFTLGILGLVKNPGIEIESFVRNLAFAPDGFDEETRITAWLALTNIGGRLKERSRFKLIEEETLELLSQAKGEVEKLDALHVIGNLGSQMVSDHSSYLLHSPSPMIRSAALETFRFIKSQDATEKIISLLRVEANESVIVVAVSELIGRNIKKDDINFLLKLSDKFKGEFIRHQLIKLFFHVHQEYPMVIDSIVFAAKYDPKDSVRALARSYLDKISS